MREKVRIRTDNQKEIEIEKEGVIYGNRAFLKCTKATDKRNSLCKPVLDFRPTKNHSYRRWNNKGREFLWSDNILGPAKTLR